VTGLKIGFGIAVTILVILIIFLLTGIHSGENSEKPKPHHFSEDTRLFNNELQKNEVSEHLRNEGGERDVTIQVLLICVEGLKLRQTNSFKKIFYMEANETIVVTIRIDEEELTFCVMKERA